MKQLNPSVKEGLWQIAEGDYDTYRNLLLNLLIIYFDINEEKEYSQLMEHFGHIPDPFSSKEEYDELTKYIQTEFPKAPNGSRGIRAKITERLIWFKRTTNESDERIKQAVDLYIEECINNNRFAMLPHGFIYKNEQFTRERKIEDSALYEYIQRLDEGETSITFDPFA